MPLFERIALGDTVAGAVWRGELVWVEAEGVRQQTDASPAGESETRVGGMLPIAPTAVVVSRRPGRGAAVAEGGEAFVG